MLKNALLYGDVLEQKFNEIFYELKYMYYTGETGHSIITLSENNRDGHQFVSVDKNNKVLGYISYHIDWLSKTVHQIGAISFDNSYIFAKDLKQTIDDVFYKYNLSRIEWFAFADNPACKGYNKFIKRYGGNIVGYLHKTNILMDGRIHDSIIYEILKEDYKGAFEKK